MPRKSLAAFGSLIRLRSVSTQLGSIPLLGIALSLVGAVVGWVSVRVFLTVKLTKSGLKNRECVALRPSDQFDPKLEHVVGFAAQISRVAGAGFIDRFRRRARSVGIALQSTENGQVEYRLSYPVAARAVAAAAIYPGVEIEPVVASSQIQGTSWRDLLAELVPGLFKTAARSRSHAKVRAELVLARKSVHPLARHSISPDQLDGLARAFASLRDDLEESASIQLSVLALAGHEKRKAVRTLRRQAERDSKSWRDVLAELDGGRVKAVARRRSAADTVDRRKQVEAHWKLGDTNMPMFKLQVLVSCSSRYRERALAHLQALISGFEMCNAENRLKVRGIAAGRLLSADTRFVRRWFDLRERTGLTVPRRNQIVTATELVSFLKPPTKSCQASNVVRSGGSWPSPPPLEEFKRLASQLPLGIVQTITGPKHVAAPLLPNNFGYVAGQQGYGKTEDGLAKFIHLALSGHGAGLIDPPGDAKKRAKPFLTHPDVARRCVDLDFQISALDARVTGWNPLSMVGIDPDLISERTDMIVAGFAAATGWGKRTPRAMAIITRAVTALLELAVRLNADERAQPTIFQIPTLLRDRQWREDILIYLSPTTRRYWQHGFEQFADSETTPITNLFDRLESSRSARAILGQPVSTYRAREAMDQGKIVMFSAGSMGDTALLAANLFLYDLFGAALSRHGLSEAQRKPFYVLCDEIQTYDADTGNVLASVLEQARKFGLLLHLMNQFPSALTDRTLRSIRTNARIYASTKLGAEDAKLLCAEFNGLVTPEMLTELPAYNYGGRIATSTGPTKPFRWKGVAVDELYADLKHDDRVPDLEREISTATRPYTVRESLEIADSHDARVLTGLHRLSPQAVSR